MRRILFPISLLALAAVGSHAWAAGQMKPGLWEMTMKSDELKAMPPIPELPPEQLKQMRDMGIEMPVMRGGGMVSKVCITKEMAARDEPATADVKEMGCETKNYKTSGGQYSFDLVCNSPEMKGQGKVSGVFAGNESFSSRYQFKGTAHGEKVDQKHETTGKWISADCGTVKPVSAPTKKK